MEAIAFPDLIKDAEDYLARERKDPLFYKDEQAVILCCDVIEGLRSLPDKSIQLVLTSPPYWALRDYGDPRQIGLEPTFVDYLRHLAQVADELYRVVRDDGSMYWVLGDTYMKKHRLQIPSLVALTFRYSGWALRNDLIWHKVNHMPSSVKDRYTNAYDVINFFVKEPREGDFEEAREQFLNDVGRVPIKEPYRYYFNLDAIRVPHKTQSLERYQRAVNQQAWGKPYSGKFTGLEDEVNEQGGMQASAIRRGISVNPPGWFEENLPPDKEYRGKFNDIDCLERPGGSANNLELNISHQNRNFMSYKPKHFELLSKADKAKVLEALKAGLRVDIVTKATAANIKAIDSGRAKEIEEKGYAIYLNHPLGSNPGDVVQELTSKEQFYKEHGGTRKPMSQIRNVRNPVGKNPGDIVSNLKGHEGSEVDPNLVGHAALEEYLYKCRAEGRPEGHPSGRNPGDIVETAQDKEEQAIEEGDDHRSPHIEDKATRKPKQGKTYKTRDPERHINPIGSNPGDVIERGDKGGIVEVSGDWLNEICPHCGRTYRRHFGLQGGKTVFIPCSAKGANPGDIVENQESGANTGINNKEPYQQNNPHLARLKYGHEAGHPEGKNPSDVVKDFDRTKEKSEFSPPHRPARFRESDFQQDGNYPPHPEGSNPGDVVPQRKFEHNIGAIQHREGMDSLVAPLHPLGHNPGDITGDSEEVEQNYPNLDEEDAATDFQEHPTRAFPGMHFSVMPKSICINPILASSQEGDPILDPFCGSGTTLGVAKELNRNAIGIDLVASYCEMSKNYVTNLETKTIICPRDGSEVIYTKDLIQHTKKSKPEKNDVCLGRVPFKVGEAPCKECQRGRLPEDSHV